MKRVLSLVFCLLVSPVVAQVDQSLRLGYDLYDVTGVANDDVLNIHAAPNARSAILAVYPPSTKGIEVTGFAENGRWARVQMGEVDGWVAKRYLALSDLSPRFFCFGMQPFWYFDVDNMRTNAPDYEVDLTFQYGFEDPVRGAYIWSSQDNGWFCLRYNRALCGDGMSETSFAYTAEVDWIAPQQSVVTQQGCCRIGHATPSYLE